MGEAGVFEFGDAVAGLANQELGGVGMVVAVGIDATDEGGEPFEAMDKALFLEEFEGAVDGGGSGGAALGAQPVEQVVGSSGGAGFEDEAENVTAQPSQAGAAVRAFGLGLVE